MTTVGKACPNCGLVMTHRKDCQRAENGSRCALCGLIGWHWTDCPAERLPELDRATRRRDVVVLILILAAALGGLIAYLATR
jgi:hypothetical protein